MRVYVELGGDPRLMEQAINKMIVQLQHTLDASDAGSLDARVSAALIDMMPGFVRAFERDRVVFQKAKKTNERGFVDEHLMIMATPMINMIGSIIMAMTPCEHVPEEQQPCPHCAEVRIKLTQHMCENITAAAVRHVLSEKHIAAAKQH